MKQEEGSHQGFLWPGLGKPIFLCVYFLSFPNQFIYLRISAYLGELRHTRGFERFHSKPEMSLPPVFTAGQQGLFRVVPHSQFFAVLLYAFLKVLLKVPLRQLRILMVGVYCGSLCPVSFLRCLHLQDPVCLNLSSCSKVLELPQDLRGVGYFIFSL